MHWIFIFSKVMFLGKFILVVCHTAHADPTISTSTPTPCYGDVVTLVCHHPEVASNPGRYFSTGPSWREDGVVINLDLSGSVFTADTLVDLTRTTLNINITVDHFRNKSFNYSCLLVLAENGLPSGEVETSENVTVDPVGEWVCISIYIYIYIQCFYSIVHTYIVCIHSYTSCIYVCKYTYIPD